MPAKRLNTAIPYFVMVQCLAGYPARHFLWKRGRAMKFKAELMDETAVRRALARIAHEIVERNKGTQDLCFVGIRRRGEVLAGMIREDILQFEGVEISCGDVDINFYRDDLTTVNDSPVWKKSDLPFDVTGKRIVLVDDVLYTGRTARAGIEAIIACGRPKTIQLAVLIDRGHRELPFRADYIGKNVPTSRGELIEVHVPEFDGETRVCLMELGEEPASLI